METTLYITVGVPGSGKSTFAKDFISKHPEIKYLSSDELRAKFGSGEEDQSVTPQVFGFIKNKTKNALSNGKSVLVDSTAVTERNRKDFVNIAKETGARLVAFVFLTKESEVKRRNLLRDRKVPEWVIDKMLKSFKIPTRNEGFDEILKIK